MGQLDCTDETIVRGAARNQSADLAQVTFDPAISEKRRDERMIALCDRLTDLAAAFFCVSGRELRSSGRCQGDVARVRQIAMYAAHVALGLTMAQVGRGFGRNRATVVHACHLIEDMRDDEEFDGIIHRFEMVTRAALAVVGAV
jgi:chromosomal replication initiation ATPase DnaA